MQQEKWAEIDELERRKTFEEEVDEGMNMDDEEIKEINRSAEETIRRRESNAISSEEYWAKVDERKERLIPIISEDNPGFPSKSIEGMAERAAKREIFDEGWFRYDN